MPERPYITCRERIEFLHLYLDGKLPPDRIAEFERHLSVCDSSGVLNRGEKREAERHLAGCRSCLSYWKSYRTTVALARRACSEEDAHGLPMPETLTRRIRDAVRTRPRSNAVFHVVHFLSGIAAAPALAFWLR